MQPAVNGVGCGQHRGSVHGRVSGWLGSVHRRLSGRAAPQVSRRVRRMQEENSDHFALGVVAAFWCSSQDGLLRDVGECCTGRGGLQRFDLGRGNKRRRRASGLFVARRASGSMPRELSGGGASQATSGGGRRTDVEGVGGFHPRRSGVFEAAVGAPSVGLVSIDVLKVTVR